MYKNPYVKLTLKITDISSSAGLRVKWIAPIFRTNRGEIHYHHFEVKTNNIFYLKISRKKGKWKAGRTMNLLDAAKCWQIQGIVRQNWQKCDGKKRKMLTWNKGGGRKSASACAFAEWTMHKRISCSGFSLLALFQRGMSVPVLQTVCIQAK